MRYLLASGSVPRMRLVIIESPYAGDIPANLAYLDRCILDCLSRGEAPFASHRLYVTALDDADPVEREQGIQAGFAWRSAAAATVVYLDRGISRGMQYGIDHAIELTPGGHCLEYREIGDLT